MRVLLLFLFYYLVVTPIGMISRLVRDPLSRRSNASATTYWIPSENR